MTPSPPSSSTTVVFLGPSLPHATARTLLDARYLPPAGFGDVYRWIGGGVSTIVLIDGVFHGRAPVWPRELLYAVQSGVRVYGASSMGALRAAELRAHGMIGLGRIFQWYVDGEIDGDDEVALLHAGPEQGYRPLSEPLVNLRCTVQEAIARRILEPDRAAAMIAALEALPFWERSVDALWDTPAACSLEEPRRAALHAFLEGGAIQLKARDATLALVEVARRQREPPPAPAPARTPAAAAPMLERDYYDRFRLLKRALHEDRDRYVDGYVDGQALVDHVFSEPVRRRLVQRSLGARFFVHAWARDQGIGVPADEREGLEVALEARLRDSRLTEAEHRELLDQHRLWTWILSRDPEQLGLSPALRGLQDEELLPVFPELGVLGAVFDRRSLARALPYVAAWCEGVGAAPDSDTVKELAGRWRGALRRLEERHGSAPREPFLHAVWALERGPIYFGFATWSPATALLCALQITGTSSRLASTVEVSAP